MYPLSIDIQSNDGSTPLLEAACHTQNKVVGLLTKNKANREIPNNNGNTPLLCAAQLGHVSTVKELIAIGANAVSYNKTEKSALYFASKRGSVPLIKLLMTYKEKILDKRTKNSFTPLLIAAYHGHESAVITLLNFGADATSSIIRWEKHREYNCR